MKIVQEKKMASLAQTKTVDTPTDAQDKWLHTSTGQYAGFQYKYRGCPTTASEA